MDYQVFKQDNLIYCISPNKYPHAYLKFRWKEGTLNERRVLILFSEGHLLSFPNFGNQANSNLNIIIHLTHRSIGINEVEA